MFHARPGDRHSPGRGVAPRRARPAADPRAVVQLVPTRRCVSRRRSRRNRSCADDGRCRRAHLGRESSPPRASSSTWTSARSCRRRSPPPHPPPPPPTPLQDAILDHGSRSVRGSTATASRTVPRSTISEGRRSASGSSRGSRGTRPDRRARLPRCRETRQRCTCGPGSCGERRLRRGRHRAAARSRGDQAVLDRAGVRAGVSATPAASAARTTAGFVDLAEPCVARRWVQGELRDHVLDVRADQQGRHQRDPCDGHREECLPWRRGRARSRRSRRQSRARSRRGSSRAS